MLLDALRASLLLALFCNPSSAAFRGAVIVEFEDYQDHDVSRLCDDVSKSLDTVLTGPSVKPRREFSSSVFRGASFDISSDDGDVSLESVQMRIQRLASVKKVWPVTDFYPAAAIPQPQSYPAADSQTTAADDSQTTAVDSFSTHVMTGVDKLHALGITGKGVTVAILDGGFDYTLAALGGGIGEGFKVQYGHDYVGDAYTGSAGQSAPDDDPYANCSTHGTHVAGIVGANPSNYGVVGVAPDANLELHRIFGCDGGAGNDVILEALAKAYERGVDVITGSFGSNSGFPESPLAVAAQRINDNGTLAMFSAGNIGEAGAFTVSDPAVGIDVLAVGSVENSKWPFYTFNGSYTAEGETTEITWTPGSGVEFPQDFTVYAQSLDPDADINYACGPFEGTLTDPDTTVVLVRRGMCSFSGFKGDNVYAFGAKYVLVYDTDANGPAVGRGPAFFVDLRFPGLASLPYDTAATWMSLLRENKPLKINLASVETAEKKVDWVDNNVSGNRMSRFSAWGPTLDARTYVTVSGPGGSILSLLPSTYGGYGLMSGTSMSTPFLAGVAALLKQADPSRSPLQMQSILATTAKPMQYNDNSTNVYDFLAPTFQQGGGLVDAYAAVYAETLVNVSSISFNDTKFKPDAVSFNIANTGNVAQTYSFSHIGAGAGYTFPADTQTEYAASEFREFDNGLSAAYADITISPATVTVEAGQSVDISVSAEIPSGLTAIRVPFYSGFIAINSTTGNSLTLPYGGIASALYDVPIVDESKSFLASFNLTDSILAPVDSGTVFEVTYRGFANITAETSLLPAVQWRAIIGTRRVKISLVHGESDEQFATLFDGSGYDYTAYTTYWYWDGTDGNGTFIPAGTYKYNVRGLRITGDENREEDYDSYITDAFEIRYSNSSVALPTSS